MCDIGHQDTIPQLLPSLATLSTALQTPQLCCDITWVLPAGCCLKPFGLSLCSVTCPLPPPFPSYAHSLLRTLPPHHLFCLSRCCCKPCPFGFQVPNDPTRPDTQPQAAKRSVSAAGTLQSEHQRSVATTVPIGPSSTATVTREQHNSGASTSTVWATTQVCAPSSPA